jgi:hypothetical protein
MPRIGLIEVSEDAPKEIRRLMKKIHMFQFRKGKLTKEEWEKWWNFFESEEFNKYFIIKEGNEKATTGQDNRSNTRK